MWQYIAEEPTVLRRLLIDYQSAKFKPGVFGQWTDVYLVAHGSSYNASVCVSSLFSRLTGLPVWSLTPAEFVWWPAMDWRCKPAGKSLVIAISQTGTSSGVLEAAAYAKKAGCTVFGITNEPNSALTRLADSVINLDCGFEDSNAKTKGYSATLLVLILLGMWIGKKKGVLPISKEEIITTELAAQVEILLDVSQRIQEWCIQRKFYHNCTHLLFIGSGMNFGTALEGQLKLVETMTVPALACNIQEFSHGIHRLVKNDTNVVLFAAEPNFRELIFSTFYYLEKITSKTLLLNASDQKLDHPDAFHIPYFKNTESILLQTIAVQVLSVTLPEMNGLDPNRPANNDYTTIARTRI